MHRLVRRLLIMIALLLPAAVRAGTPVQTSWQLIDYIAVDYRGAVDARSRIVSQLEYDEMREFSRNVARRLATLPAHPAKAGLVGEAQRLEVLIARRTPPAAVEAAARRLAARLLVAYPVTIAPAAPPDPARGAALYRQHCAACHGTDGRAQTPAAASLDPPPIVFTDRARARERSLFALYQAIGQGLDGTAMRGFGELSPQDRWALAFQTGRFAFPAELAPAGERLWRGDGALRARFPGLQALAETTPSALAAEIGAEPADALTAFLRANPDAVAGETGSTLAIARDRLRAAAAAYRRGHREQAGDLALSAYLDGFEPVEAMLAARRGALVGEVEREMAGLRAAIDRNGSATDIDARTARLLALFERAELALAPDAASPLSTFLGAFAILLREGLEALLIVIAMITFLVRAERREMLRWVHGGWAAALAAGIATWWAASHVISISGAGRETTEGFGSLLAAAILLFVGLWLHGKSRAGAWQLYVKQRLDRALGRGSAWLLFALAFVAVYREVFETILFFTAIGGQGQVGALAGGIAAAVALLALIAWAMLRLSRRLPIAKFFQYSAALIAVLAVVLAGKGLAALQEAGLAGISPLEWAPRSPMFGVYPTIETLALQLALILVLAAGYRLAGRSRAAAA
ncbi:MAG: cytochrome c/FTR1 family iron permease [Sphingosinicella sp.]